MPIYFIVCIVSVMVSERAKGSKKREDPMYWLKCMIKDFVADLGAPRNPK